MSGGAHLAPPQALVADLDDTVVDTFGCLIEPLEARAAQAMVAAGYADEPAEALARRSLRLRREAPAELEDRLRAAGLPESAIAARRAVLADVPLDALALGADVEATLRALEVPAWLLTAGPPGFQRRKVERLGLEVHFERVVIVDAPRGESKRDALAALRDEHRWEARRVVVVGNRLDDEVRAAAELGMRSVWLRHGEGSEMSPAPGAAPDHVIERFAELPGLLRDLLSRSA